MGGRHVPQLRDEIVNLLYRGSDVHFFSILAWTYYATWTMRTWIDNLEEEGLIYYSSFRTYILAYLKVRNHCKYNKMIKYGHAAVP